MAAKFKGRVVVKGERPEARRPSGMLVHLLHRVCQLAAVKVRVDSLVGWEELIMNETATAPPNTEHKLFSENGRF